MRKYLKTNSVCRQSPLTANISNHALNHEAQEQYQPRDRWPPWQQQHLRNRLGAGDGLFVCRAKPRPLLHFLPKHSEFSNLAQRDWPVKYEIATTWDELLFVSGFQTSECMLWLSLCVRSRVDRQQVEEKCNRLVMGTERRMRHLCRSLCRCDNQHLGSRMRGL